jgi:hypothetical protein
LVERSDNGSIIEKEEKIMTQNYNDNCAENEALVKAMVHFEDVHWRVGYLESFIANAMCDIPELKERVEDRIVQQIKLRALDGSIKLSYGVA